MIMCELLTMSPSTGKWQVAGAWMARSAKEAAREFKRRHPEQTVAARRVGGKAVRP